MELLRRYTLYLVPLLFAPVLLATGVARSQVPDVPDPRLDQKITYAAYASPLQQVAADLSRVSHVEIRVGAGERDWKVKERKVHVSFRNLPLGTVLAETARTLGYTLRKSGKEGEWSYRIWQNNPEREYEAAMLAAQNEEADRKVEAIREKVLKDVDAVQAMSKEDALKLKDTDPWLAYLGGTDAGRSYAQLLGSLPPDTRDLMLRGKKVALDASDLSPELQTALHSMIPKSIYGAQVAPGAMGDMFKTLQPTRIVFQPLSTEMGSGAASQMGMSGMAIVMGEPKDPSPQFDAMVKGFGLDAFGKGFPMISLPLTGGDSPMGKLVGKAMLRFDAGDDVQSVQRDMMTEMQSAQAPDVSQLKKIVPSPKPLDPRLLAETGPIALKVDPGESQATALIKELAKTTPLSYVVEHYPEELPFGITLSSQKTPLYMLLDTLQLTGLTWEFGNGVVRIRPRDWAVQRSYDVQESFLAAYRKSIETQGWLDLDQLAGVSASLTDGQIVHRFLVDKELQPVAQSLISFGSGSAEMLRLYGSLGPAQKARLATEGGLSFQQLTQAQWQGIAGVVEDATGGAEIKPGTITLKVEEVASPLFALAGADDAKKPDSPPAGKPGEPGKAAADKAGASKGAMDKKAAKDAPGGANRRATFTIEMPGDSADQPYRIEKTVTIAGKDQIAQVRKAMEAMRKAQEEKDKAAKTPAEKPAPQPTAPAKSPK